MIFSEAVVKQHIIEKEFYETVWFNQEANKKNEREQEAGMGQKVPFEGVYPHYFKLRLSTHGQLDFLTLPWSSNGIKL